MAIKKSAGMTSVTSYLNMAAATFGRLKVGADIPEELESRFSNNLVEAADALEDIREYLIKTEGGPPNVG